VILRQPTQNGFCPAETYGDVKKRLFCILTYKAELGQTQIILAPINFLCYSPDLLVP